MKLSKLLLSAIVAGIAIQGASSCNKKDKEVFPKTHKTGAKDVITPDNDNQPDNCLACGRG